MLAFELSTAPEVIEAYLKKHHLINDSERVENITKPGEGNMNVVLRVKTGSGSYILKQSRDFVQKYPDIPAPIDRIQVEHRFYKATEHLSIASHFPEILWFDDENHLIIFEDLGEVQDMTQLYQQGEISESQLSKLVNILVQIHQIEPPENYPANLELRKLNHQHIFVLPFLKENGFDLDTVQEGLQALSLPYKADTKLIRTADEVGKLYLDSGNTLLHGDYYPGSWMLAQEKLFVLDPEFSFIGFKEFDLGVMAAHLIIISGEERLLHTTVKNYGANIDLELVNKVAGIEIIRRLIGLAQLPLNRSLPQKARLLELARKLVVS